MSLAHLRKDYTLAGLAEKDLAKDPFRQFDHWFQEAGAAKLPEPNAATLATATRDGRPGARTVLLKGVDGRGFVFYSSYESRKGRELEANPRAVLVFSWLELERQVIVEGEVARVSREESDAYFHSRPPAHQLSAWVSTQSATIPGRTVLEESYRTLERKYAGQTVPLPPHWGGSRLNPGSVEFWQGRRNRLHDRLRYRRDKDGGWTVERIAP